jgi:hypothetical protein
MSKTLKPGQTAPRSGQYAVVGPRGGNTGCEVTVTKGEPMPPTQQPCCKQQLDPPDKAAQSLPSFGHKL